VLLVLPLGIETLTYALATLLFVVLYDLTGHRWPLVGVLCMGLARGANVMIGIGAGGGWGPAWEQPWLTHDIQGVEVWLHPLAILLYTATVTLESQREDHLGRPGRLRLPFNLAFYCLPAALGSLMCSREMPVAQVFWIIPMLLGLANGRAYAARPSLTAARRTVRDGLLAMPAMDGVVVATVVGLGTDSAVGGLASGGAVAALGLLAYALMRLGTPAGRIPTADDSLEEVSERGGAAPLVRFHVDEQSQNRLALADGTFRPGGTWLVMRCEVPATLPARFLLGIGEIDPEIPDQLPIRVRPQDRRHGLALADALCRAVELQAPDRSAEGPTGWLDLCGKLLAAGVSRRSDGAMDAAEPGDWTFYEVRWVHPMGGRNVVARLGLNLIVGVGELSFTSGREQTVTSWEAMVEGLVPSTGAEDRD
jgi:hypothetical protein